MTDINEDNNQLTGAELQKVVDMVSIIAESKDNPAGACLTISAFTFFAFAASYNLTKEHINSLLYDAAQQASNAHVGGSIELSNKRSSGGH